MAAKRFKVSNAEPRSEEYLETLSNFLFLEHKDRKQRKELRTLERLREEQVGLAKTPIVNGRSQALYSHKMRKELNELLPHVERSSSGFLSINGVEEALRVLGIFALNITPSSSKHQQTSARNADISQYLTSNEEESATSETFAMYQSESQRHEHFLLALLWRHVGHEARGFPITAFEDFAFKVLCEDKQIYEQEYDSLYGSLLQRFKACWRKNHLVPSRTSVVDRLRLVKRQNLDRIKGLYQSVSPTGSHLGSQFSTMGLDTSRDISQAGEDSIHAAIGREGHC